MEIELMYEESEKAWRGKKRSRRCSADKKQETVYLRRQGR